MNPILIQVQCYAGYKADESPCRFFWGERWIEVKEIRDRWYQGNRDPEWPISDYFKIVTDDGEEHLIKHDGEYDEWFLVDRWGAQRSRVPGTSHRHSM